MIAKNFYGKNVEINAGDEFWTSDKNHFRIIGDRLIAGRDNQDSLEVDLIGHNGVPVIPPQRHVIAGEFIASYVERQLRSPEIVYMAVFRAHVLAPAIYKLDKKIAINGDVKWIHPDDPELVTSDPLRSFGTTRHGLTFFTSANLAEVIAFVSGVHAMLYHSIARLQATAPVGGGLIPFFNSSIHGDSLLKTYPILPADPAEKDDNENEEDEE
jgi:hypothetical protein